MRVCVRVSLQRIIGLSQVDFFFFSPPVRRDSHGELLLWQVPACCWAMGFGHHHGNSVKATGWGGSTASALPSCRSISTLLYEAACTFLFSADCWMTQCAAYCVIEAWKWEDCACAISEKNLCCYVIEKKQNSSLFHYGRHNGICSQSVLA